MAKSFHIGEAQDVLRRYLANPDDVELQVLITDITHRFPKAMILMAAGRHDVLISHMPEHYSIRKGESSVQAYEPVESKALRQKYGLLVEDAEVDDDDEENGSTERVVKKRGRKSSAVAVGAGMTTMNGAADVDTEDLLQ